MDIRVQIRRKLLLNALQERPRVVQETRPFAKAVLQELPIPQAMEQRAAQRVLRVLLGDSHLQFVILRRIQSAMSVHCTRSNLTHRLQLRLA